VIMTLLDVDVDGVTSPDDIRDNETSGELEVPVADEDEARSQPKKATMTAVSPGMTDISKDLSAPPTAFRMAST
jgi:hypothetical protein